MHGTEICIKHHSLHILTHPHFENDIPVLFRTSWAMARKPVAPGGSLSDCWWALLGDAVNGEEATPAPMTVVGVNTLRESEDPGMACTVWDGRAEGACAVEMTVNGVCAGELAVELVTENSEEEKSERLLSLENVELGVKGVLCADSSLRGTLGVDGRGWTLSVLLLLLMLY